MIFPTTNLACLLLLAASVFCLALWTLLHKLTFKWRYELYYYDVTWGFALGAVAAAFTLGSMNSQELTFQDNLILTGYRKMAWAMAAGGVFNLGNVLLIAAAVVGRMSLAFPVSLGTALVLGMVWEAVYGNSGSLVLNAAGAVVLIASMVVHLLASFAASDSAEMVTTPSVPDPRLKRPKAFCRQARIGTDSGHPQRAHVRDASPHAGGSASR